jgi:hypothetical protein
MSQVKKTIKIKKSPVQQEAVQEENVQVKRVIKLKKSLPIPRVNPFPVSNTEEAFEILREYYSEKEEPIPQSDLKWYYDALEQDKKDMEKLWIENPTMKAMLDSVEQGYTDEQRLVAEQEAKKKEPPKAADDIGPMPEYGSKEFWIWCHKRKALRLAKEAAIIAAGGTVPPPKLPKPRKTKSVAAKAEKPKA